MPEGGHFVWKTWKKPGILKKVWKTWKIVKIAKKDQKSLNFAEFEDPLFTLNLFREMVK